MSVSRLNPIWVLIPAMSLTFIGCSKNSNDDIGLKDPGSVKLTTISSHGEALAAAQPILGIHATGSGAANSNDIPTTLPKLLNFKLPQGVKIDPKLQETVSAVKKVLDKPTQLAMRAKLNGLSQSIMAKTTTEDLCDEGSIITESDGSQTSGSATITFKNCKTLTYNGYNVVNGTIKAKDSTNSDNTESSSEISIGNGDANLEDNERKIERLEPINNGKATLKSTTTDNSGKFSITINGRAEFVDSVNNTVDTISIDQVSLDVNAGVDITNQSINSSNLNFVVDGAIEVVSDDKNTTTSPDERHYFGASNLSYSWNNDGTVSSETLDGRFVVENTPAQCGDGAYQLKTVTPMQRYNYGALIAGEMNINDNTNIKVNTDGTISVTVNGTSTTYADEAAMQTTLDGVCSLN